MATSADSGDKYRSYLTPEELQTTQWNAGTPNYDVVNKLFEEGRTKVYIYACTHSFYLPFLASKNDLMFKFLLLIDVGEFAGMGCWILGRVCPKSCQDLGNGAGP